MVIWTADVVRVRTTHDGVGRTCDVVTGMGATPEQALETLRSEAKRTAQKLEQQAAEEGIEKTAIPLQHIDHQEERGHESPHMRTRHKIRTATRVTKPTPSKSKHMSWQFEVVDVRLTPGPVDDKGSGWLAYGTLAWEDE